VPVRGQYLEIDPPHRVLVSWGVAGNPSMPPGATEVEFTLTPTPAGTRLRLIHRGLPPSRKTSTPPAGSTSWPGSPTPPPETTPTPTRGTRPRPPAGNPAPTFGRLLAA